MNKNCTVYKTTDFLGKRWSLLILLELYKREKPWKRFTELKKRVPGITAKMLSLRLKELEALDIIKRRVDMHVVPVKCEYSLSKSGRDFIKIIKYIKKWALKWKLDNTICENTDCSACEF